MKILLFFLIFLFLLIMIPVYILFLPKPIDERNCFIAQISPDKFYKVIVCDASYKIFYNSKMGSLKIYDERTRKLIYKDVYYFVDASKFFWDCKDKICSSFIYLGHERGITVNLPPNYWHRLRAKIPLWAGE